MHALILHYSISLTSHSTPHPDAAAAGDSDQDQRTKLSKLSPKQQLLAWINQHVADRQVNNFTSDWKDGKTLAALVSSLAPGDDAMTSYDYFVTRHFVFVKITTRSLFWHVHLVYNHLSLAHRQRTTAVFNICLPYVLQALLCCAYLYFYFAVAWGANYSDQCFYVCLSDCLFVCFCSACLSARISQRQ